MSSKPVLAAAAKLSKVAAPRFTIQADWRTPGCMLAGDALALVLVFGSVVVGRHVVTPSYPLHSCLELIPCLAIVIIALWAQGLYPGVLLHPAEEMRRVFLCVSIVALGVASTTFLWRNAESYSRSVFVLAWLAASPSVLLVRYLGRRLLAPQPWWGVPAVVLGSGPVANKVVRSLRDGRSGVKVTCVLAEENILDWSYESQVISESRRAQYAIVAMPERPAAEVRMAIQDYCRGFSHVILVPDMPGLCSLGLSALEIGGGLGVELPQRLFQRGSAAIKRGIDIVLAGLLSLVMLPLGVCIALAIKVSSPGKILYIQNRVGRHGAAIKALKFRTMAANADEVLEDYLNRHPGARAEWLRDHKLKNDPRVTTVGKWLRRFSLDELPQLWNVLSGEMSLVGPRPIVDAEMNRYGRRYELYTRVRPGITGLWQVSGRNNTTYEARVAFDEYYVRNWSIWLDAYLLVCTVKAVLTAEGAY